MSGVSFDIEWQYAPGVRDPVLARTWGRLTLRIGEHVITRVRDLRTPSERNGVYGTMFPLAEWLVENFWFITSEIPKSKILSGRRDHLAPNAVHRWMLRHCLLSAGAGAALPNLTFASEGSDTVVAAWFPDPANVSERRTVRFLGEGRVSLAVRDVQAGVTTFVNSVLAQLEGFEHKEVARLRRDWQAVGDSMSEEETLCRHLAKLGMDPYDVEDDCVDTIENAVAPIPPSLQNDLLDSESLDGLAASARYALDGSKLVLQGGGPAFGSDLITAQNAGPPAHEAGYRIAHEFRKAVGIAHDRGVPDLETLMSKHAVVIRSQPLAAPDRTSVRGVIGFSSTRSAVLVTPQRPPATLRFLLGRALGSCLLGQCDKGPRLLTDAFTWEQAAARAFSAELLAPQAALAQRVRAVVSSDELRALAQEFGVGELVVAHQIENHQLATVVPD